MDLKVNNRINFCASIPPKNFEKFVKHKYTGIPNFHPRYQLNPKQTFKQKVIKYIKALYYANFK